jgi:hypothetical protein
VAAPVSQPYDPLPEGFIRLARVNQDPSTGGINCWTQQFPLYYHPLYTAVPYACGSPPASSGFKLNGVDWYIRKNLFYFLRQRVRMSPASGEWLWMDAICINQENGPERAHQVRLMADIYGQASWVLVWLGPAYQDSDAAMRGLSDRNAYKCELPVETIPWTRALCDLCSRDYWRRLWCLQELKLAKTKDIMCGSKVIPWRYFERFITSRRGIYGIELGPAIRMVNLLPRNRANPSTSLWSLLHSTTHLLCEEKKDKAYALLGLALRDAEIIQPYYTLDMPVFLNRILKCHIEHDLINDEQLFIAQNANGLTLPQIAWCCEHLENLFGTEPGTIFQLIGSASHPSEPGLMYRRLSAHTVLGMSLLWATHYDHHPRVQELIKLFHRRHSLPMFLVGCVSVAQ